MENPCPILVYYFPGSLPPFPRKSLSTSTDFQKSIQVCILGAETPLGRTTSFLMKQNPLISILKLHGETRVDNLVVDLGHMDTRCKALAFEGSNAISKALRVGEPGLLSRISTHNFLLRYFIE